MQEGNPPDFSAGLNFAKSLPDLLSEFSFRQQITSHASGLLLASSCLGVSVTFSSSGTVSFPSAKSQMLYFQLFPTGQSRIVLKDGTVALLFVLTYQL